MHIGSIYSRIPAECEIDIKKQKRDSRLRSIKEVAFDVALGCGIATAMNYTILPHYIETIQTGEPLGMLTISFWYVAASFIRKYVIRRWFVNMKNRRKKKSKA